MTLLHDMPKTAVINSRAGNSGVNTAATLSLIEWLTGDECHALDEAGLVAGLGRRLRALDLPIDRLTLHLTTLHPEFIGRTFAWDAELEKKVMALDAAQIRAAMVKHLDPSKFVVMKAGDFAGAAKAASPAAAPSGAAQAAPSGAGKP